MKAANWPNGAPFGDCPRILISLSFDFRAYLYALYMALLVLVLPTLGIPLDGTMTLVSLRIRSGFTAFTPFDRLLLHFFSLRPFLHWALFFASSSYGSHFTGAWWSMASRVLHSTI